MSYVLLPLSRLELGRRLPIDVWDAKGHLLLKKGHPIDSQHHKEILSAHQASITSSDAKAWQKSYERMIHNLLQNGATVDVIARAGLPSELLPTDYMKETEVIGGWLDLQEVLRGLLYQAEAAISPLQRLAGIEKKSLALLKSDPDQGLFVLFQALAQASLGYCATHALLVAVVCELTAEKLALPTPLKRSLFRAALVMNIGMARPQDCLAAQSTMLNESQKKLIQAHPQQSLEILQNFGVIDKNELDLVRWHHELDESSGLPENIACRRILRMADSFVAKMAARKTRLAMSPLGAAKSIFLGAPADSASLGAAMAAAIGFYPPGTYVQLINGEKAVSVAQGAQANTPHVVSIINAGGMPLNQYLYRDTSDPRFSIRAPLNAEKIRVNVSLDKVLKVRMAHTV